MRQIINKLMARIDPGCKSIARTSSAALDRPLALKERFELFTHLMMCNFCRRYHHQLMAIHKVASGLSGEDGEASPQDLTLNHEARERIKRAIDQSNEH
jgi:hypothetical protein